MRFTGLLLSLAAMAALGGCMLAGGPPVYYGGPPPVAYVVPDRGSPVYRHHGSGGSFGPSYRPPQVYYYRPPARPFAGHHHFRPGNPNPYIQPRSTYRAPPNLWHRRPQDDRSIWNYR